jgi:hypothetical protein
MPIFAQVPEETILGLAGKKIIFHVQVELPRLQWRTIRVEFNYANELGLSPSKYTISEPTEVGFTSIRDEILLPDHIGEFRLGTLRIIHNGDDASYYLPRVRVMTLDGFFEESVAKCLRALGFDAKRWGGRDRPDIIAFHPKQRDQVMQVEATTEKRYDIDKWRSDIGKFYDLKDRYSTRRLLVVTLAGPREVSTEVKKRLARSDNRFSLICYDHLDKLQSMFGEFQIGDTEVIAQLGRAGFIEIVSEHGV